MDTYEKVDDTTLKIIKTTEEQVTLEDIQKQIDVAKLDVAEAERRLVQETQMANEIIARATEELDVKKDKLAKLESVFLEAEKLGVKLGVKVAEVAEIITEPTEPIG